MIDENYKKSCKEVIEILSCIPKEDYAKIPNEIIKVLENDKDENYNFEYDPRKTLDEQNVSKQAKTIIAIFFRDYWSNDQQRKKIKEYENACIRKMEEEKNKKYNPNRIFLKDNQIKGNTKIKEKALVNNDKTILKKILSRIKSFFYKKVNNIK